MAPADARCGPAAGSGGRGHSGARGAEREPGGELGWYADWDGDAAGRAPEAGLPR
ncbi:hypothetical protein [Acidovorax sp. SUPP3334]|uniref:hypothetical protein n=1 Tax=Acidovorax sp. SUPP3334 TaxID=2920881 RepID=UPI0024E15974|nr:hypothetical protein [Acidovorax sp. SUPP3334]